MRISLEPCYLLHSRPYRETSLLLEALSQSRGRIGLVARGARGSRSRWKNMLQAFRPLLLSWSQRGELGTLTGAEQVASPPPLTGESLFCGFYANELIMGFLQRNDPHPGLFEQYSRLLTALSAGEPPQPLLRQFEKRLMRSAGFGLLLDQEFGTGLPVEAGRWYEYIPEQGPTRCDPGTSSSGLVSGQALLALQSGRIEQEHLKELKNLMRRLIRHHLGDRELRSQALFY